MYFYHNGSYDVMILNDGTKIRYNKNEIYNPERVENIDIKITNKCDMKCKMCHENSLPDGKHCDFENAKNIINSIPQYTELAIGGGNPIIYPKLIDFLTECKNKKLIANITVNKIHFVNNFTFIKSLYLSKLIYGIGISVFDINDEEIKLIKEVNGVCHVIMGVTPLEVLNKLANNNIKILVLGYKYFRRGINYYKQNNIENRIVEWRDFIKTAIKNQYYSVISFDNLAIKQIELKNILSQKEWNAFFMGDDGIDGQFNSGSMYIDLVENKFTINSCAPLEQRYNCSDFNNNVNEMFSYLLEKNI